MYRTTPHQQLTASLRYTQQQTARLQNLQLQVSTGIKIHRPSDDPVAQQQILQITRAQSAATSELSTLQGIESNANSAHTAIRDAQQIVVQVRNLTLQARQTTDSAERQTLATQVDGLLSRLVDIGNTRTDQGYIFGGMQADQPPFQLLDSGKVQYQGGTQSLNGLAAVLPTGASLFMFDQSPTLTISSNGTGAQVGTGISVGSGRNVLEVTHTATTFTGASGIAAGSSSVAEDTVIGAHQLTIVDTSGNGTAGTISLNGGEPISFTSADTNLQVTGANGEIVYVDTSNITAGFNGTIDLNGEGTLSLDGGPATPITFESNQQLIDASGKTVRYLDTTGLVSAGQETLDPSGGTDLFTSLQLLKDDLLADIPGSERDTRLKNRLLEFEGLNEHILSKLGQQSAGLERLQTQQTRLEDLQLSLAERLGEVQNTDLTESVLRLQEAQLQAQFTLSTTASLLSLSILDYLG
ncbi:MAG: flagellar hook-associated protein FlgL [Planctomycetaceae bacterium]|nr:flagellar hook-associated protein FlgL [Planctomycetaceae bacterium]